MENLYKILNCNEDASVEVLRKSYMDLALRYHPDKRQGECGRFIQVNQAWRVLSDDNLRKQYDTRWRERCLMQTYPIQDTVGLEDFVFVESINRPESGARGCQADMSCPKHSTDTDRVSVTTPKYQLSPCKQYQQTPEINNDRSDCPHRDSACEDRVNNTLDSHEMKHTSDDMENNFDTNREYHYECRCGGTYILTQLDIELKFDIVCCDTCSLAISVVYNDDDDKSMTETV